MHIAFALAGIGLGCGFSALAQAQAAVPASGAQPVSPLTIDPMWKDSFDAFAASDKATPPHMGGVLFVGSSSIRLWDDLEDQFTSEPHVMKRGFGGSRMADVARYVPQLVLPYRPSVVIVYAGDNDIAEGRTPEQVLQSFQRFVAEVHQALPATRIAYLSIKPSPSRVDFMTANLRTNSLIADYVATDKSLAYIDIYDQMLGADGRPRRDLFRDDMLHLNPSGYAIWKSAITGYLRQIQAQAQAPAPASASGHAGVSGALAAPATTATAPGQPAGAH